MRKLLRPEYNRMYEVMKVKLVKNLSKCIFVLLIFHLVQSFLFSLTLSPLLSAEKNSISISTFVFATLSTVFVFFISFQFIYGMISYFTKLILSRLDIMGVFSSGFRDKTKRAHFLSIFFTFIFIIAALLGFTVIYFYKNEILFVVQNYFVEEDMEQETIKLAKAVSLLSVFCSVFFPTVILLLIPFLFTWNILIDDKKISFFAALKKSCSLMIKNYFHFIGFVFYTCIKNIVFIILLFSINLALGSNNSVITNFISILIGFFAFTQQYTIIAKAYTSIPIYYYSLLSVNGMINTENKKNENSSK